MPRRETSEFFRTYYAPNNAVVAIVGDVDTKDALAKAEKYFGNIPRQSAPKPADLWESGHTGERKREYRTSSQEPPRSRSHSRFRPTSAPTCPAWTPSQ